MQAARTSLGSGPGPLPRSGFGRNPTGPSADGRRRQRADMLFRAVLQFGLRFRVGKAPYPAGGGTMKENSLPWPGVLVN